MPREDWEGGREGGAQPAVAIPQYLRPSHELPERLSFHVFEEVEASRGSAWSAGGMKVMFDSSRELVLASPSSLVSGEDPEQLSGSEAAPRSEAQAS